MSGELDNTFERACHTNGVGNHGHIPTNTYSTNGHIKNVESRVRYYTWIFDRFFHIPLV